MAFGSIGGPSAVRGEDLDLSKEATVKGKITIGDHSLPLESGKVYEVRVEAFGFQPNVEMQPGGLTNVDRQDRGDTIVGFVVPQETRTHRLLVVPSLYDEFDQGPLDYTLTVVPIVMAKEPLLNEKAALTKQDPLYDSAPSHRQGSPPPGVFDPHEEPAVVHHRAEKRQ